MPRANLWTPEQDAVLRERYVRDGMNAVAAAVGRAPESVINRAHKLGIVRKPQWTARDDEALRLNWGDHDLGTLSRMLGRTQYAIYWRAGALGLARGCPDGYEYLACSATRTGYDVPQLRRILKWAGVGIRVALSRKDRPSTRRFHFVDPLDVDDAVAAWCKTEYIGSATRRHGLGAETLLRWLRAAQAAGVEMPPEPPGKRTHWRVPSDVIDRVVAERRSSETVKEAARRHGMDPVKLTWWLRWAGYSRPNGRFWRLPTATFDKVVADRRALMPAKRVEKMRRAA